MDVVDFLKHLSSIYPLNEEQLKCIRSKLITRRLLKNENFLIAGNISHQIGFILNGVYRVYFVNPEGVEITKYFLQEGNFIVDLKSYYSKSPSEEYIQSCTNSTLVVLSNSAMEELSMTVPVWNSIVSQLISTALMEKINRLSLILPVNAAERYELFVSNYHNISNIVQLKHIASYLGITNSSLSRIRSNASKKLKD